MVPAQMNPLKDQTAVATVADPASPADKRRRLRCSLSLSSSDEPTTPRNRTRFEVNPTVSGCILHRSSSSSSSRGPLTPQTSRAAGIGADQCSNATPDPLEALNSSSALRAQLHAKVRELATEREDYNRQLREIKQQAEDWRRRRDELRKDMRQMAGDHLEFQANSSPGTEHRKRPVAELPSAVVQRWGAYLPPEEVQRLLRDDPCAICLEPLLGQAQVIALCGHVFHKVCLEAAAAGASGSNCPSCRQPIDRLDPERLRLVSSLVLRASVCLPRIVDNIREATVSVLLVHVTKLAQGQGELEVSVTELRSALEHLQQKGNVFFDGIAASFF